MKGDEGMRKIKFRAKRLDNGKWVFGVPIPNSYGDRVFFIPLLLTDKIAYPFERLVDWVVEVMPETIGQYTGLKDKNGVEIYESDIVFDRWVNEYTPVFQNGIYMAYNPKNLMQNDPSTQFNIIWKDGCEVIGNIYETPELLETKKD